MSRRYYVSSMNLWEMCRNFRAASSSSPSPSSSECCLWNSLGHFVNFIALNMCQKTCTYITTSYFCISSISYWPECCRESRRLCRDGRQSINERSTLEGSTSGRKPLITTRVWRKFPSREIKRNIINQVATHPFPTWLPRRAYLSPEYFHQLLQTRGITKAPFAAN